MSPLAALRLKQNHQARKEYKGKRFFFPFVFRTGISLFSPARCRVLNIMRLPVLDGGPEGLS
jgi:hypothetical protein